MANAKTPIRRSKREKFRSKKADGHVIRSANLQRATSIRHVVYQGVQTKSDMWYTLSLKPAPQKDMAFLLTITDFYTDGSGETDLKQVFTLEQLPRAIVDTRLFARAKRELEQSNLPSDDHDVLRFCLEIILAQKGRLTIALLKKQPSTLRLTFRVGTHVGRAEEPLAEWSACVEPNNAKKP